MSTLGTIRIGISGWRYAPWRGKFYPPKLVQKKELSYAANKFPTIEINGTFYSLQRPNNFLQWAVDTPDDFVFAIKGSRYITHMRRLNDIQLPLANFFASGIFHLGAKLGPFLWQFPPNFRFELKKMAPFLKLLPKTLSAARSLARKHDERLTGRAALKIDADRRLRHAVEIRNESFVTPAFIELLREHNVALVCADTVEWPLLMDLTSDFIYVRLHGSEVLYASGYDDVALDGWAHRVFDWASGKESRDGRKASTEAAATLTRRDVYVYFDNDAKVRAPADAESLIAKVATLASAPSS